MELMSMIQGTNQVITLTEKISKLTQYKYLLDYKRHNCDYIVDNYVKSVTIYKDGHGIMTCSCDLYIINPEKIEYIYRKVNIGDGDINSVFPSLQDMQKCGKDARFSNFGFWFDSTNNFVSSAEEYYWQDYDYSEIDIGAKNNPKELRWRFKINNSILEPKKVYNITYSLSIKGMYPISDYKFDKVKAIANLTNMSSVLELSSYIRNIKYIISFERDKKDIEFINYPTGEIKTNTGNNKNNKSPIKGVYKCDNFYQKFIFITKHRKFSNKTHLKITWKIK